MAPVGRREFLGYTTALPFLFHELAAAQPAQVAFGRRRKVLLSHDIAVAEDRVDDLVQVSVIPVGDQEDALAPRSPQGLEDRLDNRVQQRREVRRGEGRDRRPQAAG